MEEHNQEALNAAARSKCSKRKVGAVIVNQDGAILATACNYHPDGGCCEDAAGATKANVIHAEAAAIDSMKHEEAYSGLSLTGPLTIYTTHAPCADCSVKIQRAGIENIVIVETFMKFDTDKLRYDLLPPEWHEGDAQIITFGAKKYKPNNWREVDDTNRYVAALERHLIAFKKGEMLDPETGLHHMKHLRTNAGFLLTLTKVKDDESNDRSDS